MKRRGFLRAMAYVGVLALMPAALPKVKTKIFWEPVPRIHTEIRNWISAGDIIQWIDTQERYVVVNIDPLRTELVKDAYA